MTREIKFRAWGIPEKKMYEPYTLQEAINFQDQEAPEDNIYMQYTGLKDKNGKEIYEGDVIEWSVYEDAQDTEDGEEKEIRFKDSVGFSNGCFKVEERVELLFNLQAPHRKLEIIGNIYENPELLSTNKDEK